ncbi:MAG TPA: DNA topology modulation protein [Pyrinomonadaceae bacterium]|nr:DNA topology modulation protein [Pyrinomonadaceae bacterium]
MRKVLVIGSGGAGKSTFARRLGKLLSIEVIHLDTLYWNAGWVETPKAAWAATVAELVGRDSWIMDGNYSGTFDIRLKACDAVVFLDMPRLVCLWRVLKRLMIYRNRSRPDMAEGCDEKLNWEFILWVWNYPKRTRPKITAWMRENSGSKKVIWLRSPAEVERYLADAGKASFIIERR